MSPIATFAVSQGRKSSLTIEIETDGHREHEILDDEDVDPIDPTFYSPQKSASSASPGFPPPLASPPSSATLAPVPPPPAAVPAAPLPPKVEEAPEESDAPEDEENAEAARRQTIAQRMAKLGGIRFGVPPPISRPQPPPPPPAEEGEGEEGEENASAEVEREEKEEEKEEEEEDEFARKQRIAARIAGMGGMRFGMVPPAFPPARTQPAEPDQPAPPRSSLPTRSTPVPPPPPRPTDEQEEEAEHQAPSTSDGEQIDYEESEAEEIDRAEAVEEEGEEEAPPPIPSRATRPSAPSTIASRAPPVPQVPRTFARPPVPVVVPKPPPAPLPAQSFSQESQSDFVMVEDPTSPEEPPPPPPPPRPSTRAPPPRSAPPAPPPPPPPPPMSSAAQTRADSTDGQWEMPTIPNVDFGGETDLSLSAQWSEDSTNYPPPPPPKPAVPESSRPPAPAAEVQLSSDDLMVQWGRVGVQVCEVATTLLDKSKKNVVGDGTYLGFVFTVLREVPNAAQPHSPDVDGFGYLIYAQNGPAVQRRASDIMPGDIIVLEEAKLKGHKGLQTYHIAAGGPGDPCIGVVSDFEAKKSKVKVFQANRHVGQQVCICSSDPFSLIEKGC